MAGNSCGRVIFSVLFLSQDLSFSDVICLEVPEKEEGKSQGKTYSYQDLVDLQSRLMLVVGQEEEGKSNVERFISVIVFFLDLRASALF